MSPPERPDIRETVDTLEWPRWIPIAMAGAATASVAVAVAQRGPLGSIVRPAAYGLIAILPFLLDVVDEFTRFKVALPLVIFPIPTLIGGALLVNDPAAVDFAPTVFLFMTAETISRAVDRRWVTIAVPLASIGVMAGADVFGRYDDSFIWVMGISFAAFGGFLIQNLARTTIQLKETQAELAERSAAEERQRIAREIHDVIAHSMSVTMLHITAARMALERDRSADALEALREAEQQGRNSLNEIRRTVGLLGPDEAATAPPMPTAADLPKLVADFRNAGLDVELSMNGDLDGVPTGTGLNLYRIVQESLTNVAKHAPGASATVDLTIDGRDIRLRIHNSNGNGADPVDRSGSGLGLKGMAGRAAMMGGSLSTENEADGWTVTLTAPRDTA